MKKIYNKKNISIISAIVFCLLPILITLRTCVCLFMIEKDTGFYVSDVTLPYLFDAAVLTLVVIIALIPLFCRLFSKKVDSEVQTAFSEAEECEQNESGAAETDGNTEETVCEELYNEDEKKPLSIKTRLVCGEGSFFCTFSSALFGFILIACAFLAFLYRDKSSDFLTLSMISYALLALSGLYFVLWSAGVIKPYSTLFSLFSLVVPISLCVFLVVRYLDVSPNSFEKMFAFDVVTIAALVLYFLGEAKLLADVPKLHALNSFTAYALISLILISCSAVPAVILAILSEIKLESFVFICVAEIFAGIHISSRLINIIKNVK